MDISSWNIEVLISGDDKIHVDYKGKAESSSEVQMAQKDNTLTIQQNDGSEKNVAEQFSLEKQGAVSLLCKPSFLFYLIGKKGWFTIYLLMRLFWGIS